MKIAIIGGGASGLTLASKLSENFEIDVFDPSEPFSPNSAYNFNLNDYYVQRRSYKFHPNISKLFNRDSDISYETSRFKYSYIRNQVVGGRLRLWEGACYRFPKKDFRNWPIEYDEIEPFYSLAEDFVSFSNEKKLFTNTERKIQLIAHGKGYACQHHRVNRTKNKITNGLDIFQKAIRRKNVNFHFGFFVHKIQKDRAGKFILNLVSKNRKTIKSTRFDKVVLAAGCIESTKILLNSQIQDILLNSNFAKYLTNHLSGPDGFLFECVIKIPKNEAVNDLIFIPQSKVDSPYFLVASFLPIADDKHLCNIVGFSNIAQRSTNRLELSNKKDIFGINQIKINFSLNRSDKNNLMNLRNSIFEIGAALVQEFKGDIVYLSDSSGHNGLTVHESGTCRMGNSPHSGVVSRNNEFFGLPNLFISDGAAIPFLSIYNPTLTIIANSMRLAEYLNRI